MKQNGIYALFFLILSLGCGTEIQLENSQPSVTVDGVCRQSDHLYFQVTITDAEQDFVDLALIVGEDGNSEGLTLNASGAGLIGPGPEGAGLLGLVSGVDGHTHFVQWAKCPSEGASCSVTSRLHTLAAQSQCMCIVDDEMFHVLHSVRAIVKDSAGNQASSRAETLEIANGCDL